MTSMMMSDTQLRSIRSRIKTSENHGVRVFSAVLPNGGRSHTRDCIEARNLRQLIETALSDADARKIAVRGFAIACSVQRYGYLLWLSCLNDVSNADRVIVYARVKSATAKNAYNEGVELSALDLDGAEVELEGNVRLVSGDWIHALQFVTAPRDEDWTNDDRKIFIASLQELGVYEKCFRKSLDIRDGLLQARLDYALVPNFRVTKKLVAGAQRRLNDAGSNYSRAQIQRALKRAASELGPKTVTIQNSH